MTDLFAPITLGPITLRNRIGVAPMCQYSAANDGRPTQWHLAHLLHLAMGGAGLVIVEATAVTPEGRISPGDLGLWEDGLIAPHAALVAAMAAAGAVPGIQLGHAGRKASRAAPWIGGPAPEGQGWEVIAPSAVPFADFATPRAMSEGDILATIEAFAAAARRAAAAGYRFVELHGAHGYLGHQFLSPLSNTRNDAWGGDFEGRTRFLREATAAVRAALPAEVALGVRLSHTDWVEGGWTTEETVELCRRLKALGADLLDISSGGLHPGQKIVLGPGYQVPGARAVREGAGVATAAVGLITEPAQAQAILAEGSADMVLLARALLKDPFWPQRAAVALGRAEAVTVAPQYERGWHGTARLPMQASLGAPLPPL